ncbi:MAG: aromatic amino acid lyase, partial [Phycisphaerales bacterium]|nr:aromatic amino acid lyase [Phycisphaerales bacterium]
MPKDLSLDGGPISIADVVGVARRGLRVRVASGAMAKVKASRRVIEARLSDGQAHYGINTGFGSLARKRIGQDDLDTLQRNLIRSHTAGVGEPLSREVTRAMMVCLAGSLSRGHSGVRPEVIQLLVGMLNKGVTPVVASIGSVGASGDLAPLAAVALAMIGEGACELDSKVSPSEKALAAAGLKPITLKAKEGLALINGTHLMCGRGALLCADAATLQGAAEAALAMSIDACRASHSFLDPRLYIARNQPELLMVGGRVSALLRGSAIRESHREDDPRVQDPYSLRAGVTVLGAAAAQLNEVTARVTAELGAVTDNPLVFQNAGGTADIVSGANFHGMPLAIPLDTLAIAVFHIAGISERRSYLLTGAFDPESHLKPFLTPQPGLSSGLM